MHPRPRPPRPGADASRWSGPERRRRATRCSPPLTEPACSPATTACASASSPGRRTATTATTRAGLRPPRRPRPIHAHATTPTHRVGPSPRPRLNARHHPLPNMRRPLAHRRGRLRRRRHRPRPPRRPSPARASSSRPTPAAPPTRRHRCLSRALGRRFVVLALPLAPRTVQNLLTTGSPPLTGPLLSLPRPQISHFEPLKRAPTTRPRPSTTRPRPRRDPAGRRPGSTAASSSRPVDRAPLASRPIPLVARAAEETFSARCSTSRAREPLRDRPPCSPIGLDPPSMDSRHPSTRLFAEIPAESS